MKLFAVSLIMLASLCVSGCHQQSSNTVKVGVVVPLTHQAMDEIVAGFTETLKNTLHRNVVVEVQNAEGDANLERAIIQQMRAQHVALIVPIGTDASQMTLALTHQPVVSLAADFSQQDRERDPHCRVAVVHDEIPVQALLQFMKQTHPALAHLVLIHSASNKVFPEVQAAIAAGKAMGIEIKNVMVSSLPELTSAAAQIPSDTQGIFVLKDHLIVSGVATLAHMADARHIPLMTSDQGSVESGAGFALGVHEREIGVEGAKLVAQILQGKNACALPIVEMKTLTVFVNKKALEKSGQSVAAILAAAKLKKYRVEYVENVH